MFTAYQVNKDLDRRYRGQSNAEPAKYITPLTCTIGARTATLLNSTVVALNATAAAVDASGRLRLWKATAGGTTSGSLPAGFAAATGVNSGGTVTDGTVTWTDQTSTLTGSTSGIPATAVEPSGGSFARVALTQTLAGFNATQGGAGSVSSGTSGSVSNAAQINFASPTGDWAKSPVGIWAYGLMDALTAGNLLEVLPDTTIRNVANGDQAPYIAAGALAPTEA